MRFLTETFLFCRFIRQKTAFFGRYIHTVHTPPFFQVVSEKSPVNTGLPASSIHSADLCLHPNTGPICQLFLRYYNAEANAIAFRIHRHRHAGRREKFVGMRAAPVATSHGAHD